MLEAFDPGAKGLAKSFVSGVDLSDAAVARLESGQNVRRYLERLVKDGLALDALVIIARALRPGACKEDAFPSSRAVASSAMSSHW